MAYYSSNFYESNSGEYYDTPYADSYDIVPFQEPETYSGYEYREPGFVEYNSTAHGNAYDPFLSMSEINYSTHSITEPKLIEYNPNPYGGAYDPYLTRSDISYSTYSVTEPKLIEYNPYPYGTSYYYTPERQYAISYSVKPDDGDDTDYEEYDTTPYGGGYDPVLTYGRPLAPSDEICYPRSDMESNVPSYSLFDSIPSPYGKDDVNEPSEKPDYRIEPESPTEPSYGEPLESYGSDNYDPWSGYGYGYGGGSEDYGSRNGCDSQVVQAKYDYGIDALDLCESFFGYWPCLYKNREKNHHGEQESGREENQWRNAADCLFGSPFGNGADGTASYGGHPYNYDRHYLEN